MDRKGHLKGRMAAVVTIVNTCGVLAMCQALCLVLFMPLSHFIDKKLRFREVK